MIEEFQKFLNRRSRSETTSTRLRTLDRVDDRSLLLLLRDGSPYIPAGVVGGCLRFFDDSARPSSYRSAHGRSLTLTACGPEAVRQDVAETADLIGRFFESISSVRSVRLYYVPVLGEKRTRPGEGRRLATPISAIDVNSGVTQHLDGETAVVLVYRRQEAAKVVVHELLHAYRLDATGFIGDDGRWLAAGRALADRWGVRSSVQVRLNEAYTETLASFLYAAVAGLDMERMRAHFLDQAEKVICILLATGMQQATHAFEYYVVKAALFHARSAAQVARLFDEDDAARRRRRSARGRGDDDERLLGIMFDSTNEYMARAAGCGLSMTTGGAAPRSPARAAALDLPRSARRS